MKTLILTIISFFCLNTLSNAQQKMDTNTKILVAYFSCTGNTESIAKAISKSTGGKLYKITPLKAYSSADLDWTNKNSRSSIEMNTENSRPELGGETVNMKDYDIVFIGYPIWWDSCPRPVNTFIEKYDLSGKSVIPFATSGGSSIDNSVKQLKKLYPDVNWKEGRLFNRGSKQAEEWAKQIITK